MAKFRKKPVVIDAWQYGPTSGEELMRLSPMISEHVGSLMPVLTISTLEGVMTADLNDWVIKGVKGEFYPCKPDIFAAIYDPA